MNDRSGDPERSGRHERDEEDLRLPKTRVLESDRRTVTVSSVVSMWCLYGVMFEGVSVSSLPRR